MHKIKKLEAFSVGPLGDESTICITLLYMGFHSFQNFPQHFGTLSGMFKSLKKISVSRSKMTIPNDCSLLSDLLKTEQRHEQHQSIPCNTIKHIMVCASALVLSFFFIVVKPSGRSQCSHALLGACIVAAFLTFSCALLYSK